MIDINDIRERMARIEVMISNISQDIISIQRIQRHMTDRMHSSEMISNELKQLQHSQARKLTVLEEEVRQFAEEIAAKRARQAIYHYIVTAVLIFISAVGIIGDETGGAILGMLK
jgi:SMC interacting uncharacterized protein involved in chromosome segregation